MPKDLYAVLGLSRGASLDEIKKSYRRLSKELHPDRHKGDQDTEQRFKEVNEAYEILSDPQKKASYDRFGSTGGGGYSQHPFEGFSSEGFGGLGDIFEQFFGGGRGRGSSQEQGKDQEIEIQISFMESAEGTEKVMGYTRMTVCESCGGNGGESDAKMVACATCGGTGQVRHTTSSLFGMIEQRAICDQCLGSGRIPSRLCARCRGEGRIRSTEDLSVRIPAGIAEGQTLRIQGKGDAGFRGKQRGDLFVMIHVIPDKRFVRDGDDIESTVHMPLLTTLLGGEISIETVDGPTTLKIPSGTQSHQVFRLRGKGMPALGTSRRGDHFATVIVDIPIKLSRREREILEEWKSLS